jgi:hypothetical protein
MAGVEIWVGKKSAPFLPSPPQVDLAIANEFNARQDY